jgi:hypothetical protein
VSTYSLIDDHYVLPTPAGAYNAVAHQGNDPIRRLLCSLLCQETTPLLTQQALEKWTGLSEQDALESLYLAQNQKWIEGFTEPRQARGGALEELLPALLPPLSESGKILLADAHGFYVAAEGFTHEAAVELSALSADIATLDARHGGLTRRNLRLGSSAWALIDAAGNSQLGFWPLFIDDHRFVLVLQGEPRFNQPDFTALVWALSTRYSERNEEQTNDTPAQVGTTEAENDL